MYVLIAVQGPDKGKKFALPDNEPQLIGRSSEALRLSDPTISRRHAELTPNEGHWYIADQSSANGTFVNGTPVIQLTRLQIGDKIRTGSSVFMFAQDQDVFKDEEEDAANQTISFMPSAEFDTHVQSTVKAGFDLESPSDVADNHLEVIYEMMRVIGSTSDRSHLLDRVMDMIFDHFNCDRGFILLQESELARPKVAVVRQSIGINDEDKIKISRSIVRHVLRRGEGVLASNAMKDERFSSNRSIVDLGIRSAICVPIKYRDKTFGVIHIDTQISHQQFDEQQLNLLAAIGQQTGMAMANNELYQNNLANARLAAVGETVANLSHSIRNIIQGMRGGSEVVELGFRKEDFSVSKNGWDILARNLDRIYELTMNMLAYSKKRKPEIYPDNLPRLLEEIIEICKPPANQKEVILLTEFEDMPPVPFDASGLHQAVTNLVNNGIDAVEKGDGLVKVGCRYDAERHMAIISVKDNGPGIEPDQQAKIFDLFYSTKGQKGTGLGLSVTKKVVDEHRGRLVLKSKIGEGSEFIITLPTDNLDDPSETKD